MRLKHTILLSYAAFLTLAVAGIVAFCVVLTHFGRLGNVASLLLWIGGALLIVASIWSSLRLAAMIARPLEQIAAATRSISAGRFDVRVGGAAFSEGNTLGATFNEMAEALAAFHAGDVNKLLSEQRRNETVLNSIDDGLVILDEHVRIERLNPIAARQFGTRVEDALGKSLDEVLGRDDFDAHARLCLRRAHPTGQAAALEVSLGEGMLRRELRCSFMPFADSRPGLVLVVRDVTAERRFARDRNEFVLRASHELRTPLTGLRMALDLLAERAHFASGSREADLLQTVREETARLTVLLHNLLDISRLRGPIKPARPCKPEQAARAALQRFAPRARARRIELYGQIAPDLPELRIDAAECDRVLDNLLDNALRHTLPGGRIGLSLAIASGSNELELCVSDNGEGIAAHELQRIFDPFVQVGEKHGAAGLGLTLCREIVERHGGRIEAQSVPGVETRFCVYLPLQVGSSTGEMMQVEP
ncbi:MAG TPA: ATP-binding protein [Rhodanobacteraceae bacterium]|nr:ATP-binding protein [Rhodanobacteraceae bacterium]